MSFLPLISILFTAVLVGVCILLVFLILAQLPKKDAGAGLAFGGGTAEAIFGAGASTPLAQITKYCAGIFLGLALALTALNDHLSGPGREDRLIDQEAARQAAETPNEPAVAPGVDSERLDSESSASEESNDNPPEDASTAEPLEETEGEARSAPEANPPPQETPAESPNPGN